MKKVLSVLGLIALVALVVVILAVGSAALSSRPAQPILAGGLQNDSCTPPNTGVAKDWESQGQVHVTNDGFSLGDPLRWHVFQGVLWKDGKTVGGALVYVGPGVRVNIPADESAAVSGMGWKGQSWLVDEDSVTKGCLNQLAALTDVTIVEKVDASKLTKLAGWTVEKQPDILWKNETDPQCKPPAGMETATIPTVDSLGYIHAEDPKGFDLGNSTKWTFWNAWNDPDGSSGVLVVIPPGNTLLVPAGDLKADHGWKGSRWLTSAAYWSDWYHQKCATKIGSKLDYYPPLIDVSKNTNEVTKRGWTVK